MVPRAERRGARPGSARSCRPASGPSSSGTRDGAGGGDGPTRPARSRSPSAASVFGAAPRALAGTISLQQTVDLVRLSIEVVERDVDRHRRRRGRRPTCGPPCCATPARSRSPPPRSTPGPPRCAAPGTPGSRRWSSTPCCAPRATRRCCRGPAALGWSALAATSTVVLGTLPERRTDDRPLRRRAPGGPRRAGMDALCAAQGDRLVVLLGGVDRRPGGRRRSLVDLFGAGPVVVGPVTDDLQHAHVSARAALAAHRAAAGWPEAPRPGAERELLPERALAGDGHARRHLVEEVYLPLAAARGGAGRLPGGLPRPAAGRSRAPPARCSSTPTPSATGCGRSPT